MTVTSEQIAELKPCPCCGGDARLNEYSIGGGAVACVECKLSTPYIGSTVAAKIVWNRRVPDHDAQTIENLQQDIAERSGK